MATPVTTRNLINAQTAAHAVDAEAGLVAPLYENLRPPELFGPVQVLVDDLKIKRFAFTQGDHGGWYLRAGPRGPRIAHAALLANDLLQMFTFRYAPSQVVGLHTEEELWFDQPVPIDSRVTLTARYTKKFERRGQGYVEMTAEARNEEGSTVIRHRGLEIMRTAPAEIGGRSSSHEGSGPRISTAIDEGLPQVSTIMDDLTVGAGIVPLRKETTLEQVAVFSRYGEGVINIHNSLARARENGLAVPIVQGQQLVCYVVEMLTRVFGYYWFSAGWVKAKFLKPVSVFETVDIRGAIRELSSDSDGRTVGLEIWITKADGTVVSVGWARCQIPLQVDVRLLQDAYPLDDQLEGDLV
jgi:acyl dehydratase